MPNKAHCPLEHRCNFYIYPDLCSTPPDQGIRQAVLARHSHGMLSPPTIYRIPLFACDAFNARTETREVFHHTRPVSLRLARCPSIDPSDVIARLLSRVMAHPGTALSFLQSRTKNVQMLIISNCLTVYSVFKVPSSGTTRSLKMVDLSLTETLSSFAVPVLSLFQTKKTGLVQSCFEGKTLKFDPPVFQKARIYGVKGWTGSVHPLPIFYEIFPSNSHPSSLRHSLNSSILYLSASDKIWRYTAS